MGEVSQRFVEFVMMHAQNAALFLGQIPNPQTGQGEVNLDLAKMFIDQLAMIQEKTRGNLTNEETTVLRNAISNLQMAFVEVSQSTRGASSLGTAGGETGGTVHIRSPQGNVCAASRRDAIFFRVRIGISQEVHEELRSLIGSCSAGL